MSDTELRREGESGTTGEAEQVGSEAAPAGDTEQAPSEAVPTSDAEQAPSEAASTTDAEQAPADAVPTSDVDQARRDVDQTRAEMGDTVAALSQKTDLKARVRQRMDERKAALRGRQGDLKSKATQARERMSGATPEDAKRTASRMAQTAEERPFPAIGVAFGAGLLLGWLIGRD
jgi:ElaB/YqjD/DUF883 family membrane-anchored ribosome-binding protein